VPCTIIKQSLNLQKYKLSYFFCEVQKFWSVRFRRQNDHKNLQGTLSVTGDVAFVVAGMPDERLSNVAVIAWICASRLLSIWGTLPMDPWVPVDDDDDDDEVAGICWANCCCSNCSWSRLSVGSNVYVQHIPTLCKTKQISKNPFQRLIAPCMGRGQSPQPFTSPSSTLSFRIVYFLLFPSLACSIYFLAFPSLPILPEQSHSVSRPDVVGDLLNKDKQHAYLRILLVMKRLRSVSGNLCLQSKL